MGTMPRPSLCLLVALAGCGASDNRDRASLPHRDVVFVVAMENKDAAQIYGNSTLAPYLNDTLMPRATHAVSYADDLPTLPSEPHYIWMEAGTNTFDDWSATTNDHPSGAHSTASTAHLVTQLESAGIGWTSYQEGLDVTTGACPIRPSGFYAPRHNPFVFFKDVAGDPPSASAARCAAHHKPFFAIDDDLASESITPYAFITPDLCHDMHGAPGCPDESSITTGDRWLALHLPPIIAYAEAHNGIVLLVWDEPEASGTLPFIAIGRGVKRGHVTGEPYSHGALLKSVELMLGVPPLPTVTEANDFSDVFEDGQ